MSKIMQLLFRCLGVVLVASLAPSIFASANEMEPVDSPTPVDMVTAMCERIGNKLGSVDFEDCMNIGLETSGATSVEGAPILVKEYPPLANRRARGRVLLIGGIHGDEYSSVSIVFKWMQILDRYHSGLFHWKITPLMNPDGLLRKKSQRMNANGVDLNRNFPSPNWFEEARDYWVRRTSSNPRRFPGDAPLSEPESRWLNDEIERFEPEVIVSVHAPHGVLDFDGPPEAPERFGSLHLNLLGTYPGSLGRYAGVHRGIPVVTIELERAGIMPTYQEQRQIWLDLVRWLKTRLPWSRTRSRRAERGPMVGFRIFRGKAMIGLQALRDTGFGGLVSAAAIVAMSLGTLGDGDNDDDAPSSDPVPAVVAAAAPGATSGPSVETESAPETAPDPVPDSTDPIPSLAGVTIEPTTEAATPPKEKIDRTGKLPSSLLQLPPSATTALVFDLLANQMHVFERNGDSMELVGDYFVAVGKQGIDKEREGDEKTPVGLYFITSYIPGERLPAIYGVGALPIDYPNAWDRRLGRTGSGIWIHGTDKDEESLLPQSSRGCLTLHNADFDHLMEYADVRSTPVIVADRVNWVPVAELEAERASLAAAVEAWRLDWESLDTDAYLGHYSEDFRSGRMDLARWSAHKRRVNGYKSYIRVGLSEVGIYGYPGEEGLYMVMFRQDYASSNFNGGRSKRQYWRREGGEWRIVHEGGG